MNNEVAGNLNNNFGAHKVDMTPNANIEKSAAQKTTPPNNEVIHKTLGFMGTMGATQVNMNKNSSDSIKKSTQEFLANPENIQAHVDFCDSLIEHGYCLKDAIKKTDEIFEILSKKDIYN